jgi:hypothetical protein
MLFLHKFAIPQFSYQLDREPILSWCTGPSFTGGVKNLVSGWHSDGLPCTFALRDLSYYSGKVSVDGRQPPLQRMRFEVKDVAVPYSGVIPLDPQMSQAPKRSEWGIGAFLALPITHIEYKDQEDRKSADKARTVGYEVVTLDY